MSTMVSTSSLPGRSLTKARPCQASKRSLEVLDKSSFSIPLLADKLEAIRNDLHKGTGLCVLRGIDLSSLSMRELFITFAGLASHVSPQRARQSGRKCIGRLACLTFPLPCLSSFPHPASPCCLPHRVIRADIRPQIIVHMTDLSENGRRVVPAPYRNSALVRLEFSASSAHPPFRLEENEANADCDSHFTPIQAPTWLPCWWLKHQPEAAKAYSALCQPSTTSWPQPAQICSAN